ncbi:hypothetical protein D3C75_982620 [compost metagenome]
MCMRLSKRTMRSWIPSCGSWTRTACPYFWIRIYSAFSTSWTPPTKRGFLKRTGRSRQYSANTFHRIRIFMPISYGPLTLPSDKHCPKATRRNRISIIWRGRREENWYGFRPTTSYPCSTSPISRAEIWSSVICSPLHACLISRIWAIQSWKKWIPGRSGLYLLSVSNPRC